MRNSHIISLPDRWYAVLSLAGDAIVYLFHQSFIYLFTHLIYLKWESFSIILHAKMELVIKKNVTLQWNIFTQKEPVDITQAICKLRTRVMLVKESQVNPWKLKQKLTKYSASDAAWRIISLFYIYLNADNGISNLLA